MSGSPKTKAKSTCLRHPNKKQSPRRPPTDKVEFEWLPLIIFGTTFLIAILTYLHGALIEELENEKAHAEAQAMLEKIAKEKISEIYLSNRATEINKIFVNYQKDQNLVKDDDKG